MNSPLPSRSTTTRWAARSGRTVPYIASPRLETIDRMSVSTAHLRRLQIVLISRPLVGAVALLVALTNHWWFGELLATWLTYGSAIAAVHQLIHAGIGLSPRMRRFWLSFLACLVVESGHALQATHLAHHRRGETCEDPEGYIENLPWRHMPIGALRFRYRLALWGATHSPRRRRIKVEIAVHVAAHVLSLVVLPVTALPWMYLAAIHIASFLFAVFAGKGPQTNWGRPINTPLVRVQTRLGRIFWFHHDLHLEHHLYPKVPMARLRSLRDVTDAVCENLVVLDVRVV